MGPKKDPKTYDISIFNFLNLTELALTVLALVLMTLTLILSYFLPAVWLIGNGTNQKAQILGLKNVFLQFVTKIENDVVIFKKKLTPGQRGEKVKRLLILFPFISC